MTIVKKAKEDNLSDIIKTLIAEAHQKYEGITPCINKNSFEECVTVEYGSVVFWFNTPDNSTHVLRYKLSKQM